jgi:DNA polymerase
MRHVVLDSETDWSGWRSATRALVLAGVTPEDVRWSVGGGASDPLPEGSGSFNLPRALVNFLALALQARDPDRFALLYRLVWRANAGEKLLEQADDTELRRAQALAYAVRAEAHRMRTNLRFLAVAENGGQRFLAWYEPAHFVLQANAQLIARRFPGLAGSIVTPDGSAHWGRAPGAAPDTVPWDAAQREGTPHDAAHHDGAALRFGAGLAPAPADDAAFAAWWRADGAALLASARAGTSVPEAEALDEAPRPPDLPALAPVVLPSRPDPHLVEARAEAGACRRCELYGPATQAVFGEGPAQARVMFVGEQPGDQEDVIGRPFVGPAGQMLDRAMEEAGIDRRTVYVTNAVKHFKFVPRGKIRLHQKPATPEINACRPWYQRERAAVKPALVVALGATAAQSVLGKIITIGKTRGRLLDLDETAKALVTVHPSYLLRLPDADAKAREYRRFVEDLALALPFLQH